MFRLIYGFCTRFFSVHAPVCHMLGPAPVCHMLGPARLMILSSVETVSLLYSLGAVCSSSSSNWLYKEVDVMITLTRRLRRQ